MKRLALLALLPAIGAAEAPRDWAETLKADAHAFHELVVANHPGPVNALDPGFARRNDAALALALRRAASVRDYPGYLWAMRGYQASFDDGHVAISIDKAPPLATRWPGFLTGYDGRGRQVVMTRAEDAPVPLGAELVACDGVPADRLAATQVGAFRGRWSLASQRASQGGRLFVDAANPFVARPTGCDFRVERRVRHVALAWRDLSDDDFTARLSATAGRAVPPIEVRTLADGTRWVSLSDFDGDPDGKAAKALVPLIAAMARDRVATAAAPRIVLDLRGNNGGSSVWSRQIATVLWGRAAIEALPDDADRVDWRASAANVATLAGYRDQFAKAPDATPAVKACFRDAASGIAAARAAGQALWREPKDLYAEAAAAAGDAPVSRLTAPVYVLTDWGCGSACLDAVDLWTALGAVQVGQETSADTLYMDIRRDPLPSGIATAVLPMKVYRGRKRGSNVPAVPTWRYTGDMRDTAALERWIATLPERRR